MENIKFMILIIFGILIALSLGALVFFSFVVKNPILKFPKSVLIKYFISIGFLMLFSTAIVACYRNMGAVETAVIGMLGLASVASCTYTLVNVRNTDYKRIKIEMSLGVLSVISAFSFLAFCH